jgi:hypothetical protein
VAYFKISQDLERGTGINHEKLNNDSRSPNSGLFEHYKQRVIKWGLDGDKGSDVK